MKFLVPFDFTPITRTALDHALSISDVVGGEIELLHIIEKEGARSKAEDMFSSVISSLASVEQQKLSTKVRLGDIYTDIAKEAEEGNYDLLVMGTSGKTGLNRLVIGSVTEKVIREVPCSFLTLKSEDIISLQLKTSIQDIENHYNTAVQLTEDGFFEEAIEQFKLCLSINNMHVPSHYGIARVYEKMNDSEKK